MKKLFWCALGVLSLWSFLAYAVAEGELEGCDGEDVDCKVCIDDALRRAKEQVAEEDSSDGDDSSSGTVDR